MSKIVIDLSVASDLVVENITFGEQRELYFDADVEWLGNFEVKAYNSRKKTSSRDIAHAVEIDGTRLTWYLKPDEQELKPGTHYIEIIDADQSVVIFKIDLTVDE